jgi:hypothetical protein
MTFPANDLELVLQAATHELQRVGFRVARIASPAFRPGDSG